MVAKHYLETELEALLQKDRSMWHFLREGSLDGCWYWDLEHPEREWLSPEFWHLLGIDPATKSHTPDAWQDIIFKEDLEVALDNFNRHCIDASHPYDQVVRYRHADGSTVWVRCRGIAIRNHEGKPVRMLGAHNDITASKKAEKKALEDKRLVEVASEDLRTFIYAISHDMKAPSNSLHSLLTELELATDGVLPEKDAKLVELSLQTVDRMRAIIDALVSFTVIADGKLKREAVDLDALIHDIANEQHDALTAIDAILAIDDLPMVIGNAAQLRLLFTNLIANSIAYRSQQHLLRVRVGCAPADAHGDMVVFVQDNGIGIAPEHHSSIFGMFKRLHRHEEIAGSGLGLPLCRHIATNHHTDLTVTSKLGHGASFAVKLECA